MENISLNNLEFSIIVITYNPNYDKLFQTLNSIMNQEKTNFEIIIADDGTKEFDSNLIKEWIKSKNFNKYRIMHSEENVGTVRNIQKALLFANGKYIKLISPGDFLYDNNVLNNTYIYMKENNYDIIFGNAVYYNIDNEGKIKFVNKSNPMDKSPYLKKNAKKIKKSYLVYQDYILGAAFICEKKLLLTYINKIVGLVKYAEDCAIILMVADNIEISYWDNYLIWYECNTGISTSGNSIWMKKIVEDNKKCFELIVSKYPELRKILELNYGPNSLKRRIFTLKRKLRNKFIRIKNILMKDNFFNIQEDRLKQILKYDMSKGV